MHQEGIVLSKLLLKLDALFIVFNCSVDQWLATKFCNNRTHNRSVTISDKLNKTLNSPLGESTEAWKKRRQEENVTQALFFFAVM